MEVAHGDEPLGPAPHLHEARRREGQQTEEHEGREERDERGPGRGHGHLRIREQHRDGEPHEQRQQQGDQEPLGVRDVPAAGAPQYAQRSQEQPAQKRRSRGIEGLAEAPHHQRVAQPQHDQARLGQAATAHVAQQQRRGGHDHEHGEHHGERQQAEAPQPLGPRLPADAGIDRLDEHGRHDRRPGDAEQHDVYGTPGRAGKALEHDDRRPQEEDGEGGEPQGESHDEAQGDRAPGGRQDVPEPGQRGHG
jgi:hypothetical protein